MNIEEIRSYCLSKTMVEEDMPFGNDTLVFKVHGKMFALSSLNTAEIKLNLKCDPEVAISLREEHPAIQEGYHMNKKHWNTIIIDGSLSPEFIMEQIDNSYHLVWNSLPLKIRKTSKTQSNL